MLIKLIDIYLRDYDTISNQPSLRGKKWDYVECMYISDKETVSVLQIHQLGGGSQEEWFPISVQIFQKISDFRLFSS